MTSHPQRCSIIVISGRDLGPGEQGEGQGRVFQDALGRFTTGGAPSHGTFARVVEGVPAE
jgi:hypothetical protein